jgi:hypothetical protein
LAEFDDRAGVGGVVGAGHALDLADRRGLQVVGQLGVRVQQGGGDGQVAGAEPVEQVQAGQQFVQGAGGQDRGRVGEPGRGHRAEAAVACGP